MPFNITAEELPILLAETEEHLQTLDEGLVRLEREGHDTELLQAIFRATHTLKGNASMIGHWRMADLTHALETLLDSLRRKTLVVTPAIVDASLEALDAVKLLHAELTQTEPAAVDIAPLVQRLLSFSQAPAAPETWAAELPSAAQLKTDQTSAAGFVVRVDIAAECPAPAARAYQVVLALQGLGELADLQPPLAVIESAAPVRQVMAHLSTPHPFETVARALAAIGDLKQVWLNGQEVGLLSAAPTAAAAEAAPLVEVARPHAHEKTIRTSVGRLDKLMNLVGELITDRNRLQQLRSGLENYRGDLTLSESLAETIVHLSRITDQLQDEVMQLRMLPIANVFNKFPRVVRDLARKANKQVALVLQGVDTELDRSVIEVMGDPLLHLLRNAVDHGIESPAERLAAGKAEQGRIGLAARHEEGRIFVTLEDDGRGIEVNKVVAQAIQKGGLTEVEAAALTPEKALDLIFMPGLSTAEAVSEVSGRGVGMDIVRTNIEQLNGQIRVESWPGQGTRFQIILPLTLAIVPTLLVQVGAAIYALPLMAVVEAQRLATADLQTVGGKPVFQLRGQVLPLVHLGDILGLPRATTPDTYTYLVAVRWGSLTLGLAVDGLVGEQELVVKSLGSLLGNTLGVAGAAILGNGQVVLIVDMLGLFKLAAIEVDVYRKKELA